MATYGLTDAQNKFIETTAKQGAQTASRMSRRLIQLGLLDSGNELTEEGTRYAIIMGWIAANAQTKTRDTMATKSTAGNNKFLATMKAWYTRHSALGKMTVQAKNNYSSLVELVNKTSEANAIESALRQVYGKRAELEAKLIEAGVITVENSRFVAESLKDFDDDSTFVMSGEGYVSEAHVSTAPRVPSAADVINPFGAPRTCDICGLQIEAGNYYAEKATSHKYHIECLDNLGWSHEDLRIETFTQQPTHSVPSAADAAVSVIPAPSTPCHICGKAIGNTSVSDEHEHVYHPNCWNDLADFRIKDYERLNREFAAYRETARAELAVVSAERDSLRAATDAVNAYIDGQLKLEKDAQKRTYEDLLDARKSGDDEHENRLAGWLESSQAIVSHLTQIRQALIK